MNRTQVPWPFAFWQREDPSAAGTGPGSARRRTTRPKVERLEARWLLSTAAAAPTLDFRHDWVHSVLAGDQLAPQDVGGPPQAVGQDQAPGPVGPVPTFPRVTVLVTWSDPTGATRTEEIEITQGHGPGFWFGPQPGHDSTSADGPHGEFAGALDLPYADRVRVVDVLTPDHREHLYRVPVAPGTTALDCDLQNLGPPGPLSASFYKPDGTALPSESTGVRSSSVRVEMPPAEFAYGQPPMDAVFVRVGPQPSASDAERVGPQPAASDAERVGPPLWEPIPPGVLRTLFAGSPHAPPSSASDAHAAADPAVAQADQSAAFVLTIQRESGGSAPVSAAAATGIGGGVLNAVGQAVPSPTASTLASLVLTAVQAPTDFGTESTAGAEVADPTRVDFATEPVPTATGPLPGRSAAPMGGVLATGEPSPVADPRNPAFVDLALIDLAAADLDPAPGDPLLGDSLNRSGRGEAVVVVRGMGGVPLAGASLLTEVAGDGGDSLPDLPTLARRSQGGEPAPSSPAANGLEDEGSPRTSLLAGASVAFALTVGLALPGVTDPWRDRPWGRSTLRRRLPCGRGSSSA